MSVCKFTCHSTWVNFSFVLLRQYHSFFNYSYMKTWKHLNSACCFPPSISPVLFIVQQSAEFKLLNCHFLIPCEYFLLQPLPCVTVKLVLVPQQPPPPFGNDLPPTHDDAHPHPPPVYRLPQLHAWPGLSAAHAGGRGHRRPGSGRQQRTPGRHGLHLCSHSGLQPGRHADDRWVFNQHSKCFFLFAVLQIRIRIRIRIRRIHIFLGLLDPDPLVRGPDPDSDPGHSITKQK